MISPALVPGAEFLVILSFVVGWFGWVSQVILSIASSGSSMGHNDKSFESVWAWNLKNGPHTTHVFVCLG